MIGTIINMGTVSLGSLLGIAIGSKLRDEIRKMVFDSLGLLTLLIGFQMALKTQNILILLGSILGGGIIGEYLNIENKINGLGGKLQKAFSMEKHQRFVDGFVSSSILFCVGPMAILGSIQDGISGNFTLLAVKSTLDGFASLGLATALGWGVFFSILTILVFQGSITLAAEWIQSLMTDQMINEMSAAGGLLIVAIGIRLLNLKDVRVGNLLPALVLAPFLVWLVPEIRAFFIK